MKLYEVSNFIKKAINIVIVFIGLISAYIYISPLVNTVIETTQPDEAPVIPFKVNKINFTEEISLNYNLTATRINYLGNPVSQWENQSIKNLPIYTYSFSDLEDIDYTPKAKQVALALGYDDLNQIDNAEISNKYKWIKNGIVFEIDKLSKRMIQIPTQTNFAAYKQYLTAGNFVSIESVNPFIVNFLQASGRFTGQEISQLSFEPVFLTFEGSNLYESNSINSELSYVKVFRKLSNLKVVSKKYEFPQIYFYVTSLRPEIQTNFPNFRLIHFKLNKVNYQPSFENFQFELLPLPNAVEELKQKRFIISDISFRGEVFGANLNPQNINISNITFDSYEFGYYDNYEETVQNTYLQPIYIFKGNVELDSGARGRITVYLPAIDTKYLN